MKTITFSIRILLLIVLIINFTSCTNNASKQEKLSGEEIFRTNCSGCHNINGGQKFGPSLMGVSNKRDEEWLVQFIRSSHRLIKNGDEQAKVLFDDFQKKRMPDHQHLSDKEIAAILSYIEENSPSMEDIMDTLPMP